MNVLLHICCAPCAIFPVEELKRDGHRFAGYYYNPNIHPYSEYIKREDEISRLAKVEGFNVIYGQYEIDNYFQHVVYNEDHDYRCPACWWLRMSKAARFAVENGFEAFSTTLLGSPYQDHAMLKGICEDVAEKSGLKLYYSDFRKGFDKARDKARSGGIYLQNYCGCVFSERERMEKRGKVSRGEKGSKGAMSK